LLCSVPTCREITADRSGLVKETKRQFEQLDKVMVIIDTEDEEQERGNAGARDSRVSWVGWCGIAKLETPPISHSQPVRLGAHSINPAAPARPGPAFGSVAPLPEIKVAATGLHGSLSAIRSAGRRRYLAVHVPVRTASPRAAFITEQNHANTEPEVTIGPSLSAVLQARERFLLCIFDGLAAFW
jgi:hypothetical protein